ncbi:pIV [Simian adenovirus 25]|uniref:PIV n=1 Tax=Simian adenovirus 25 TaxID=175567 RepID=Q8UY68_9ADEN|nr:fiber [Simian adenovirus 25]AAL35536.1 pIV [Simian adenovirus 25]
MSKKRVRVDDDFDPVYPYDADNAPTVPFINPPFVSSDGFQEKPLGVLSLRLADPVTTKNGEITLKLGEGVDLDSSGKLISNTATKAAAPLSFSNNTISLNMDHPFYTKDGKLSLQVSPPLNILRTSILNTLALGFGSGLGLRGSALAVQLVSPLTFDTDGNIKLTLDRGLHVTTGDAIESNISWAKGLKFEDGAIATNIGNGLEFGSSSTETGVDDAYPIQVKLGSGLSFDSTGAIMAGNKEDDKLTLWTTPDPSPNCQILAENDAKLTLCLTKCGSQILATVSVLVVGSGNLNPITGTVSSAQVFLRFDANGVLLTEHSTLKKYWGYRQGDSIDGTPYTNAVGFMPNLKAYPKSQSSTTKNNIVGQVYMNGDVSKPMLLTITLNGTDDSNSTYSMSFSYTWTNGSYVGATFGANSYTFSYIAQE